MRSGSQSPLTTSLLPLTGPLERRRGVSCVGMAQLFAHPGGHCKRGNPNWGQPTQPCPATATEFEMQVRQLGLIKKTYADSKELHRWCERNRNRYYVPEWLLDVWRIRVNPTFR